MSETETLATNSADGPSLDDKPFVPSGPPLPRPAGKHSKLTLSACSASRRTGPTSPGRPLLGMLIP